MTSLYKGQLFLPPANAVFELLVPIETKLKDVSYTTNEEIESRGLKVVKSNHKPFTHWQTGLVTGYCAQNTIFRIPSGARFKIKIEKVRNNNNRYDRIPTLQFTTTLNRGGVIKGGFAVDRLDIALEVEQIS